MREDEWCGSVTARSGRRDILPRTVGNCPPWSPPPSVGDNHGILNRPQVPCVPGTDPFGGRGTGLWGGGRSAANSSSATAGEDGRRPLACGGGRTFGKAVERSKEGQETPGGREGGVAKTKSHTMSELPAHGGGSTSNHTRQHPPPTPPHQTQPNYHLARAHFARRGICPQGRLTPKGEGVHRVSTLFVHPFIFYCGDPVLRATPPPLRKMSLDSFRADRTTWLFLNPPPQQQLSGGENFPGGRYAHYGAGRNHETNPS